MKIHKIVLLITVVCATGCRKKDPFPGFTLIGSIDGTKMLLDKHSLTRPDSNNLMGTIVIDYQNGTHAVGPFDVNCSTNQLLILDSIVYNEQGALIRTAQPQLLKGPEIVRGLCRLLPGIDQKPLFEGQFTSAAALTSLDLDHAWQADATNSLIGGMAGSVANKFHSEVILNEAIPNIVPEMRLLVLSSSPEGDNTCHACSVLLSAYVFDKVGNGWFIKYSNLYLDAGGSFGAAPPAQLAQLGPNVYGFTTTSGYMNQGVSQEAVTFYGPSGNTLKKLLTLQTATDDGGSSQEDASSHSSKTTFSLGPDTKNRLFVIHLVSSGIDDDGKPLPPERSCEFDRIEYICQ